MTDKKSFGLYIKQKRIEKNYSQKDLSEMLYVSEGAVSKWERGVSYPDITLISDICRVLDISEHETTAVEPLVSLYGNLSQTACQLTMFHTNVQLLSSH